MLKLPLKAENEHQVLKEGVLAMDQNCPGKIGCKLQAASYKP